MTKHTGSVVNDEQRAKCTYVFYIHGAVDLFGSLQIGCRQMKNIQLGLYKQFWKEHPSVIVIS